MVVLDREQRVGAMRREALDESRLVDAARPFAGHASARRLRAKRALPTVPPVVSVGGDREHVRALPHQERQGAGGHAPDIYEITSNVFDAAIHQRPDLLAGIPWECTTAALLSGCDPKATESIPGTIGSGDTFRPLVPSDAELRGGMRPA